MTLNIHKRSALMSAAAFVRASRSRCVGVTIALGRCSLAWVNSKTMKRIFLRMYVYIDIFRIFTSFSNFLVSTTESGGKPSEARKT